MHIGTCVNLVQFLSHYFRFLKILVPHSLLSLTGFKVLIRVGNKGGSRMGWVTLFLKRGRDPGAVRIKQIQNTLPTYNKISTTLNFTFSVMVPIV